MNIFIDLDDTLYDTSSVLASNHVAMLLIAELKAPLFAGAKSALQNFYKSGATNWIVTARGLIDDEEIKITRQRLFRDFSENGEVKTLRAFICCSADKLYSMQFVYQNNFGTDLAPENSVLIEDDVEQVVNAKQVGVHSILFSPSETEADVKNACAELQIPIAKSWTEIENIVMDLISKQKERPQNPEENQ